MLPSARHHEEIHMPDQISTVRDYFDRLAAAFAGADPAVAQDATYDAQEFLAAEREALGVDPSDSEHDAELVSRLRQGFGEPAEVVESYRATEAKVAAALAQPRAQPFATSGDQIFGVFVEPYTYGALIFMLLSLPIGLLYFTWAMLGVSMSIGLSLLIFGFLFFLFFMSTVRAVALVECRIVETLLGERMPRRPQVVAPTGSWLDKVKFWVTDGRTWMTILYMLLRLPLGIVYFVVTTFLLVLALALLVAPFAQLFFAYPIVHILDQSYYLPLWAFPILWMAGAFDLLLLAHLVRATGRAHAKMAKAMLARPGA